MASRLATPTLRANSSVCLFVWIDQFATTLVTLPFVRSELPSCSYTIRVLILCQHYMCIKYLVMGVSGEADYAIVFVGSDIRWAA